HRHVLGKALARAEDYLPAKVLIAEGSPAWAHLDAADCKAAEPPVQQLAVVVHDQTRFKAAYTIDEVQPLGRADRARIHGRPLLRWQLDIEHGVLVGLVVKRLQRRL